MKYLVFNSKKEASQEAYKIIKSLIDENSTLGLATWINSNRFIRRDDR